MGTLVIILICLVVAYQIGAQVTRYKERTAAMHVYANFSGVWPVFPQTPEDRTVEAKADWIREQFKEHGNPFSPEVVAYWYGCNLSDGSSTAAMDWDAFILQATLDYHRKRVAHISDRAKKDAKAAAEHYGGQTFTIVSNKDFLKP